MPVKMRRFLCAVCGKASRGHPHRIYCGRRCYVRANNRQGRERVLDQRIAPRDRRPIQEELMIYACQELGARLRGHRGNAHDDFLLGMAAGFPLNRQGDETAWDRGPDHKPERPKRILARFDLERVP